MPRAHQPQEDEPRPRRHSAWDEGLRLLAVRPLTESELRRRLRRGGYASSEIEAVVAKLVEAGQLGDHAVARHFIVARAERLGHGRRRLIGDLVRRGVADSIAEAAWREAVEQGDLDPAALLRRQISRRLAGRSRLRPQEQRRVYNALLRAGFDAAELYAELAAHRAFADLTEDASLDGTNDDFA